jgi:hypothetical protein
MTQANEFVNAQPDDRVWVDQGWLVLGVTCPKCIRSHDPKISRVLYNGNYFCEGWGSFCNWALAHPARTKADKAICDALGIDHG